MFHRSKSRYVSLNPFQVSINESACRGGNSSKGQLSVAGGLAYRPIGELPQCFPNHFFISTSTFEKKDSQTLPRRKAGVLRIHTFCVTLLYKQVCEIIGCVLQYPEHG